MSVPVPSRPVGVTVVAVIAWVSGAGNLITGILLLLQINNTELVEGFGGAVPFLTLAIAVTILGAVILIVAGGLFTGINGARVVMTIFQVLSIVGAVFLTQLALWLIWVAVVSILVSVAVLVLLYTGRANAYFASDA
ncbi:hypothetical protein [Microterricola viridarii]|uniref:Uncharacterized protein n=1 Tax=Microterricola viridarii TaxID=412690 RepID=A0A1H1WB47_9MICO|nr:hypothetical protein [Microterricola viridarii]SDS94457.1 hypothetical protein SAMN04489834_2489 [Microterricola viridarii]